MSSSKVLSAILAAVAVAAAAAPVGAASYRKLARRVGSLARESGKKRLAVVPFVSPGGKGDRTGRVLSERLLTRLSQASGVQVVERALLDEVLFELKLESEGVVDPAQAKRLGRILGVDALVAGSYIPVGKDRVEVHARLIDVESARVLGAATERTARDWEADPFSLDEALVVAPPDLSEDLFQPWGREKDLRDAPAWMGSGGREHDCSGWEAEVAGLQKRTLELKARFWATRMRQPGFDARSLTRNPGSDIRGLSSRQRFYDRLKRLHDRGYAGGLNAAEKAELDAADARVQALVEACY